MKLLTHRNRETERQKKKNEDVHRLTMAYFVELKIESSDFCKTDRLHLNESVSCTIIIIIERRFPVPSADSGVLVFMSVDTESAEFNPNWERCVRSRARESHMCTSCNSQPNEFCEIVGFAKNSDKWKRLRKNCGWNTQIQNVIASLLHITWTVYFFPWFSSMICIWFSWLGLTWWFWFEVSCELFQRWLLLLLRQ